MSNIDFLQSFIIFMLLMGVSYYVVVIIKSIHLLQEVVLLNQQMMKEALNMMKESLKRK